jgi:capsular polysaccharide biosynthesis protein
MNLTSKRRLDQFRRRWWVVVLVTVVAALATATYSSGAQPTYVGKSSLMLSGRTPDQDSVMVLGYLNIFNDPATIAQLRAKTKIDEGVTFEARPAADAPIITIEATADDPRVAQDAALDLAGAFSEYINSAQRIGKENSIAEMERQLSRLNPQAGDGSANDNYVFLQQRIDDARSNSTNELVSLQPRAGVTENMPNAGFNLVTGTVGGLLLGILAALGLATLSTRLTNSADLRDKTGVKPLVEVPAGGGAKRDKLRGDRFRALANVISLQDPPKSHVITLTDTSRGRGARDVAEALAHLSAQRGSRTVLVYADNDASLPAYGAGFNDTLADSGLVHELLRDSDVRNLRILAAGSVLGDRYALATRERIVAVLNELRACADTIIVATPAIGDDTETQMLCAAADLTILVVTKGSSRAGDVNAAVEALTGARATLLGAVLIDETNRNRASRSRSQTPGAPANPRGERRNGEQFVGSPDQRANSHAIEPIA